MRNLLKYEKKKFYKDKNSEFLKFDISSQKIKIIMIGLFYQEHLTINIKDLKLIC